MSKLNKLKTMAQTLFMDFIVVILLLASMILAFSSVKIYEIGYHNTDLAHNSMILEAKHDIYLLDTNSEYKVETPVNMYIRGTNQMRSAFESMALSAFVIGLCLSYILQKALAYEP